MAAAEAATQGQGEAEEGETPERFGTGHGRR